jgi:hypothetical protein
MPPRVPNKNEIVELEGIFENFDVNAYEEELKQQRRTHDVWRKAIEVCRQYGDTCVGYDGEIDDMTELVYAGATEWVQNPSDDSVSYRIIGARGELMDKCPLPEFGEQPDQTITTDFFPATVQMRVTKELPGSTVPVEFVGTIYRFEGYRFVRGNGKNDLTGVIVPKITTSPLDMTHMKRN